MDTGGLQWRYGTERTFTCLPPPLVKCPISSESDALLEICDFDNDGIYGSVDEFPLDRSESFDFDGDGVGDNADTDDDNDTWSDSDGINDAFDSCPFTDDFDPSADIDGDGCDDSDEYADDNNDDVADIDDPFPNYA